jgi:hypothetical protein
MQKQVAALGRGISVLPALPAQTLGRLDAKRKARERSHRLTPWELRTLPVCGIRVIVLKDFKKYMRVKQVEFAELKSGIAELAARIENIRDWL